MKCISGALVFCALVPLARAQVHEWSVTNGEVSRHLFSMVKRDWTVDDAAAVLERVAPTRVQQITLREAQWSKGFLPWQGGAPHASAEGMRLMIFHERASRIPVSSIVRVKDAAVIRHRDISGVIHRKVIGSFDPLKISGSGLDAEILEIVFLESPLLRKRYLKASTSGYGELTRRTLALTFADDEGALVFVKVNAPLLSLDLAGSVTTAVLAALNLRAAGVVLRPDPWFYDRLFSAALPFQPAYETPPPASYHLDHPTIRCSYATESSRHVCRYDRTP